MEKVVMPLCQGNKRIFALQNGQKEEISPFMPWYWGYDIYNSGVFYINPTQYLVPRVAPVCEFFVTSPQWENELAPGCKSTINTLVSSTDSFLITKFIAVLLFILDPSCWGTITNNNTALDVSYNELNIYVSSHSFLSLETECAKGTLR